MRPRSVTLPTLLFIAGAYLTQHLQLSPNTVDGALLLDYIQLVSQGKRPFWDFIDVYGPLNWVFPAMAYQLFGETDLGVRLWLWCLKLILLTLTYLLVRKLSNGFYAVLAFVFLMVFLGLPWQYFQTAYSSLHALAWTLLAWWFLLNPSRRHPHQSLILAGLLTSAVIWTKINVGLFLWCGGLFYCFYWMPVRTTAFSSPEQGYPRHPERSRRAFQFFHIIQYLGLTAYALAFTLFVSAHLGKQFFLYLLWPLYAILLKTALFLKDAPPHDNAWQQRLKAWGIYGISTITATLAFLFAYYGWQGSWEYLSQMSGILTRVSYHSDFPIMGADGFHYQFNRYYWLQLPWMVTFLILLELWGRRHFRKQKKLWQHHLMADQRFMGLWMFITLNAFVMYSRADENHIMQALLPMTALLAVACFRLEQAIRLSLSRSSSHQHRGILGFRGILSVMCLLWLATLISWPITWKFSEPAHRWNSPRLAHLEVEDPLRLIFSDINHDINQVSAYLDQHTTDGSNVLILAQDEILNFNSHTTPVGGRYRYLFYLIRAELITREDFDALAPPEVLNNLLKHPPLYIVAGRHPTPMLKQFPEIQALLTGQYQLAKEFERFLVYERN